MLNLIANLLDEKLCRTIKSVVKNVPSQFLDVKLEEKINFNLDQVNQENLQQFYLNLLSPSVE